MMSKIGARRAGDRSSSFINDGTIGTSSEVMRISVRKKGQGPANNSGPLDQLNSDKFQLDVVVNRHAFCGGVLNSYYPVLGDKRLYCITSDGKARYITTSTSD